MAITQSPVEPKEAADIIRAARQDPAWFLTDILGCHPYEKQVEIARALALHRRVSVVGCNSSGKDYIAGRLLLWWLAVWEQAKVLVIGPTTRQVSDILWREARVGYNISPMPLGGRMYETSRYEIGAERFALGFATDRPYNVLGFHSPHLLVILTEAHGIQQSHIDAVKRLNPERILMTGNAFSMGGEFYASHHTQRSLWHTIQVSAFETPNVKAGRVVIPGMVTAEDIAERKADWGDASPLYRASILGEFPDDLDDTVVPLAYAVKAANRPAAEAEKAGAVIVACDVARFGRDRTVVVRRRGQDARILWRVQGRDTMQIAGWLGAYLQKDMPDTLVVDDTGVGGGVVDRLREVGTGRTRLIAFNGGNKARQDHLYVNAIAEAWMLMRSWFLNEALEPRIENDARLIGQLSSRGYAYQSDRRIMLESKTKMVSSPDEADALAMTFAPGLGESASSVLVGKKAGLWGS